MDIKIKEIDKFLEDCENEMEYKIQSDERNDILDREEATDSEKEKISPDDVLDEEN